MMPVLPMKDPNAQAAAPAEEAPAPEGAEPQEGGDKLSDLISNIGTGMSMLTEIIQGAGLPPQVSDKAQALIAGFESLAGDLAGGPQQPQGAPQMSAQEAGGAAASQANPGMRG
jgi:hypothetical protein